MATHTNEVRPISSLGYLTPAAFAANIANPASAAATTAASPLRYVGPSAPPHHPDRPARDKPRKAENAGRLQVKRGPKKQGRSSCLPG